MRLFRFMSLNFGDEMNAWLWQAALGQRPARPKHGWNFIGIGTLLSDLQLFADGRDRDPSKTIIAGSGAGFSAVTRTRPFAQASEGFVRGPHTADVLGLGDRWITDPAVLLATLEFTPKPAKRHAVSVVPHYSTTFSDPSVHVIDPCAPPGKIIEEILASELVVAEAMHGAIAADALGVPFVPVLTDPQAAFKWADWLASMELPEYVTRTTPENMLAAAGETPRLSARAVLTDRAGRVLDFVERTL